MKSLQNFLEFLNENFTAILVCIGLAIMLFKKVKSYLAKSDDEKIEIALNQLRETMLKFVTESEKEYSDLAKSGSIKRAQVIDKVYQQYPILQKAVDQAELVKLLDEAIDSALPQLREVLKETNKEE